jgi:hypothetical protein
MSHITSINAGSGGSGITTLTGNSGGAVSANLGNINIVGSGVVTVVGNPGLNTLTISSASTAFTWNQITGTSSAMAAGNGYIANNAGLVTLTLPATAAIGDTIRVAGKGAGLWLIAQNAGQTIHFGSLDTTVGVAGSLASILQYDCVELVCITANTDFLVLNSVGNLTVA